MNDKEHRNLERAGKADTDRILTIPNVLSFFRLALIPVIIVLYAKNEVWWAFGMLVLSGVTDVVDGWSRGLTTWSRISARPSTPLPTS